MEIGELSVLVHVDLRDVETYYYFCRLRAVTVTRSLGAFGLWYTSSLLGYLLVWMVVDRHSL